MDLCRWEVSASPHSVHICPHTDCYSQNAVTELWFSEDCSVVNVVWNLPYFVYIEEAERGDAPHGVVQCGGQS